ncbi:MAG TPA: hypothetical protein VG028_03445 [Terriglobia bacterium]|nr:hypothetical protein [Terriglobia bacterium]
MSFGAPAARQAGLLQKIEADPARPKFLLTEPLVGYRFALPERA